MAPKITYPYDPTGLSAECLVVGETHSLSSNTNTYRVIVPELHPFFHNEMFKMVHAESGMELRLGRDYELGGKYVDIAVVADAPVYAFLVIINPTLIGTISLKYQTLGDEYIGVKNEVTDYLVNHLIDPLITPLEKLLDRPMTFAPAAHEQHFADFQNKQFIATAIDGVASAAEQRSQALKVANVDFLINRINQLDSIIETSGFKDHIVSVADPHDVTAAQAGALAANAQAVGAFKAYAKTLAELADYINASGITPDIMDDYLTKYGDAVFGGRLKLTGSVLRVQNDTGDAYIDFTNGNVNVVCKRTGKLVADDQLTGSGTAKLQSGKNVLTVASSGKNLSSSNLRFNNKVVITAQNVRSYLDAVDFDAVTVTVTDSDSIDLVGDGTSANPLKLNVKYTDATSSEPGVVQLTDSTTSSSTALAASAAAVADVISRLTGYVPSSRKINGHSLTASITLTKAELDLDNVDNTSDINKPISAQQQTLLNQYSDQVHTHQPSSVVFNQPTETDYGIAKLGTSVATASPTDAATPAMYGEVDAKISEALELLNGRLDADTVSLSFFDGNTTASVSANWTLNLTEGATYYAVKSEFTLSAASFNLALLYPGQYQNTKFYLYVQNAGSSASYFLSPELIESSETRLHIGTLKTSLTGIVDATARSTISFGQLRSLKEHATDPTAHGFNTLTPASIGLGLLKNYPMQHYSSPLSPLAIVDGWNDFSDITDGTKNAWSVADNSSSAVANFLGLTNPGSGKYYPENFWDMGVSKAAAGGRLSDYPDGTVAATALLDVTVQFPASIVNLAEGFEAVEVVLGVYGGQRLSLVYTNTSVAGEIKVVLYWGWKTSSQVQINEFATRLTNLSTTSSFRRWACLLVYGNSGSGKFIDCTLTPSTAVSGDNRVMSMTCRVTEAMMSAPAHLWAFKSGNVGVYVRGKYKVSINFKCVSIPKTYNRYASVNAVTELQKRLGGVKIISGTVADATNIPMIPGCSKIVGLTQPAGWAPIASRPNVAMFQLVCRYVRPSSTVVGGIPPLLRDHVYAASYGRYSYLRRSDPGKFTQTDNNGAADTALQYLVIGFTDDVWFET